MDELLRRLERCETQARRWRMIHMVVVAFAIGGILGPQVIEAQQPHLPQPRMEFKHWLVHPDTMDDTLNKLDAENWSVVQIVANGFSPLDHTTTPAFTIIGRRPAR